MSASFSLNCGTAPSSQEFDGVRVNLANKQGHGAACLQQAGADLSWGDASDGFTGSCSKSELGSDVSGPCCMLPVGATAGRQLCGGVKRLVVCRSMGLMPKHHEDDSFDGTAKVVSGVPQHCRVAFALVLLGCEMETDPRGSLDITQGCRHQVKPALPHVESGIIEGEGGVIVGGAGVFIWLQQEEEGQADHVRKGQFCWRCGRC